MSIATWVTSKKHLFAEGRRHDFFKYIFKYLKSFYLKHRCYKAAEDRTGPGPSSFLRSSSPHLLLAVIRRRRNSGGTGPSSPLVPQFCISLFADIRVGPAASSSDGRSGRRGQGVRRRIRRRRRSGRSRPPVRHGQGIFLSLFSSILASYAPFSRNFYLRSWLVLFQAFSHVRSKRRGLIST